MTAISRQAFGMIGRALARVKCLFGYHASGKYLGKIQIEHIDYSTHAITYANRLQCPRCGKTIKLDYLIGK